MSKILVLAYGLKLSLTFSSRLHLFQTEGRLPAESLTHEEFTGKHGERYEVKRPQDSNLLKGDGKVIMETVKDSDYTAKQGERYELRKPKESDIFQVNLSAYSLVHKITLLYYYC